MVASQEYGVAGTAEDGYEIHDEDIHEYEPQWPPQLVAHNPHIRTRLHADVQEHARYLFKSIDWNNRLYLSCRELLTCLPDGEASVAAIARRDAERVTYREWMEHVRFMQASRGERWLRDWMDQVAELGCFTEDQRRGANVGRPSHLEPRIVMKEEDPRYWRQVQEDDRLSNSTGFNGVSQVVRSWHTDPLALLQEEVDVDRNVFRVPEAHLPSHYDTHLHQAHKLRPRSGPRQASEASRSGWR